MQYEVTIIDVKDADAIVINYHDGNRWWTVLVDAGNVGDGRKVKPYIKHIENGKYVIDYAFCTHPDKDHKGGFFELLTDRAVSIINFCIRRPDSIVAKDFRRLLYPTGQLESNAKATYNHPTDAIHNLIDEANRYSNLIEPSLGNDVPGVPLMMVGPTPQFFQNACYEMALNFAELEDEANFERYAEDELPSEEEALSVMDEVKEESPTNKSSLILLFHPAGRNYLLAGDSCSAALKDAVQDYPQSIPGCTFKVPHHGSKHNLTTEVIEMLRPSSAVISAEGSKKHPNCAVVHFLSKYCNVYCTSKSGTLTYQSAPVKNPASALRNKQE
jgi:beta-lactamase superfamily II metal-dependent hydrolase